MTRSTGCSLFRNRLPEVKCLVIGRENTERGNTIFADDFWAIMPSAGVNAQRRGERSNLDGRASSLHQKAGPGLLCSFAPRAVDIIDIYQICSGRVKIPCLAYCEPRRRPGQTLTAALQYSCFRPPRGSVREALSHEGPQSWDRSRKQIASWL